MYRACPSDLIRGFESNKHGASVRWPPRPEPGFGLHVSPAHPFQTQPSMLVGLMIKSPRVSFGNCFSKLGQLVCIAVATSLTSSANVHMPKDRVSGSHQAYGFVEFMSEEDADYAIKIMQMIKLYGKPIKVNKVIVVSVLNSLS